ncbi:acyloxyacyl hydrolase [Paraburkholderia sp. ZP32-5]|uniref:acyloxyacyl hydrolase n=1 Tax=Paraburkholderia sp. ZP32-5 TaxID=2883245 RepID=UPI001F22A6CD|nr:acyloxyacyl hydrolase [Paraburkholderia sp. ZP32-5]
MNKNNTVLRGHTLKTALALLLMGTAGVALADPFGIQVTAGVGDHHIKKLDLGLVWNPGWTWWPIGDWHFALVGEAHAAWWHTNEGNVHDDIGEFGVTPMIRFIKSSGSVRPFAEAGAGVRLLTSPRISTDLTLSTAFQFAETAGVGLQFGEHQQYLAGYRFQHVSNGGIKEPNPGINFSQLYLQYNF